MGHHRVVAVALAVATTAVLITAGLSAAGSAAAGPTAQAAPLASSAVVAASNRPQAFTPIISAHPAAATPSAATPTYTFGQQPLADVLAAAGAQTKCTGLTQNQLAAMVLAPTYPETGASGTLSPSPMTLSRYDSVAVNAGNANLFYADNPSTPYPRAFWNPGVGAWQFDSAGGWPLSTAQEMSTDTASATAASVMASRWCGDTADAGNDAARRAKAWAPWGCGSTTCESIYQVIYDPTTLNVATDPAVTRTGGMVSHTCAAGGTTVTCWRIDPAVAQGDRAFAAPGFGPTPISAAFYDYVLAGVEYRVWLSSDTGYPVTISASLTVGSNARTGLSWSGSAQLCDLTAGLGACTPQLYLRNTNTSGVADESYATGLPAGGTVLMCDWNGDGTATPGVFLNGTWFITNSTNGGGFQAQFGYGDPGDVPVCGDWDGNGTQTPGIFRAGHWYLTNTVGSGVAVIDFGYGNPGDTPVVGDWDGNGTDTPGIFRAGHWYLVNALAKPTADLDFGYGNPGDVPVVGDWNNDGRDTPGIVRAGGWYLANTAGQPAADVAFVYGDPGDHPLTGRWTAGAATTIGVVRP